MKITPQLLNEVHMDNIRQHQIGGETDGMTKEVAEDLGFMATEQVVEIIRALDSPADTVKPLTSAQQNANARRYTAEHLKRVHKQVIDPNYG